MPCLRRSQRWRSAQDAACGRRRDALFGGLFIPRQSFLVILRHALPPRVKQAHVVLRVCFPLFGERLPFLQRGREIPSVISIEARLKIGAETQE